MLKNVRSLEERNNAMLEIAREFLFKEVIYEWGIPLAAEGQSFEDWLNELNPNDIFKDKRVLDILSGSELREYFYDDFKKNYDKKVGNVQR